MSCRIEKPELDLAQCRLSLSSDSSEEEHRAQVLTQEFQPLEVT